METRSRRRKRQRLMTISSNVSSWPDLPAKFESLNDDTLTTILQFVGKKSYKSFGGLNYHCKEIYLATKGTTKETFVYGYAPLTVIIERYERTNVGDRFRAQVATSLGVVYYNRLDVLDWAIQEGNNDLLKKICHIAIIFGRINIMEEVWNNVNDEVYKEFIFRRTDSYAVLHDKLDVLKWLKSKGFPINEYDLCAIEAVCWGYIHILRWLQEEKYLKLDGGLYLYAIDSDHLNVIKWLREEEVDWYEYTFQYAAEKGILNILQWLHDEGCPWPDDDDDYRLREDQVKPEVIDWCRSNGYGNRIENN